MNHYYILNTEKVAEPVDYQAYHQWILEHDKKRRVALSEVSYKDTKCEVSTVFLGINREWDDNKSPKIFETMVFGGLLDEYEDRYSTWGQALTGHDRMIQLIIKKIKEKTGAKNSEIIHTKKKDAGSYLFIPTKYRTSKLFTTS